MKTDYSKITVLGSYASLAAANDQLAIYNSSSMWITLGRTAITHFADAGSIIKTINHENMHKVLEESLDEEDASCMYDYAFGDYPEHSIDGEYHNAKDESDWRKIT